MRASGHEKTPPRREENDGMSELRDCGDCAVKPGEPHTDGCDVARCVVTGYQRLACTGHHDCGRNIWTGIWPGEAECREFGWLRASGHPDLNRLHSGEAEWDRKAGRWVLRSRV
jgi:hypothetical protein